MYNSCCRGLINAMHQITLWFDVHFHRNFNEGFIILKEVLTQ